MRASPAGRPGFTLAELFVAMVLAIIVMGLALRFAYSGTLGSYRVVGAADRVSGWLLIAKQRAQRDAKPVGVSFNPDATNANTFTTAQYIQSPSTLWIPNYPATPGGGRVAFAYQANGNTPPNGIVAGGRKLYFVHDAPTNPIGSPLQTFPTFVQNGGGAISLIVPDFGGTYLLQSAQSTMTPPNGVDTGTGVSTANAWELVLPTNSYPDLAAAYTATNPPPPPIKATAVTYNVAFKTQPQPLFGEPPLLMPQDTAVDLTMCRGLPATNEILFAPAGPLFNQPSGSQIILWVRDPSKTTNPLDFANAGDQTLVVISIKTGLISTCPVDTTGPDPYSFAKTGLNTGF